MLTLENLSLALGNYSLSADWSLPAGGRYAVMGASGAGKSSLLLAIAGYIPLRHGRVLFNGVDISGIAASRRPVSMLFQDQNLFPHLSLLQNVVLGLTVGRPPSARDLDHAADALAQVGLAGLETRRPHQVSGGQMGRTALARVLLQARPVLLLDEPFSALDVALRHQMLDLVTEVATKTQATVLMVTHDSSDAKRFASQTIFVADGVARSPEPT